MASKQKPKFQAGQLVWYFGCLRKIARIDGDHVRFRLYRLREYDAGGWDDLKDCKPLTAREVGPDWQRKERAHD